MKRKLSTLIIVLMFVVSALFTAGCSNKAENTKEHVNTANEKTSEKNAKEKIKIAVLKGPTGMGIVKLMEENKDKYDISLYDSPDQIVSKIVNGDVDGAAIASNLAPILYNKTNGEVQLVGVNTLGVLHIVENGNTIKNVEDLKGKTIYISGKGATPEFVLNYILEKNGLDPNKDVKIEFKGQHADVASLLASKEASIAVLPEPFVTTTQMKDKDLRVAVDLTKEWEKVSNNKSQLIMGAMVFRKDFLDKRESEINEFLTKYKESVDFVNNNAAEAGKLMEKNGIIAKAKVAEMAIPKCNIVLIKAQDAKKSLNEFYTVLKNSDPKSIGGKLPDENFYYKEK
ncbi:MULTISPECIES: ABC transporter substrate-binding protein [Clostridium]|uniref:ABC transporter, phosphonate, periplasmic substrate-binding protein n=2 Tax=Clostridium TaxID=1485 RepID=A0A151AL76_9CLOT|nr:MULTISPECIES: ABC transporter substrate-binding protein [Clostridium]KYH28368.1 ABC transporter, phosphonate, periplasmic substrate-binding protein [Clostridium colicanis DSM 13634]MBE6043576.1 ABC transporter substrate-binding protein [Clostridium thermopalmarium]PRR68810.1 ABC transporter, phosphonate, periplasmic substrate-binding protein [Clostridium thermopalmarium DSM 5974]PVZ22608.1 NitT/TauT family transport system substrate-binding protein [Clostridium thermopalmarium DSM 5974]